jgi:hypothetical protein
MKQHYLLILLLFGITSTQSQTLVGKKVINITASDLLGNINYGHTYDFGTTTSLPNNQNIGASLKFSVGKFNKNYAGLFYGIELPIRYSSSQDGSSQTVYGIYPSLSYIKLFPVSSNIYLSTELGGKIGYQRDFVHLAGVRDETTHIWQGGVFYRPITAIWYAKNNTAFLFSLYDAQLSLTTRTTTVNDNPNRKVVMSNINVWGHFNPTFGIQLLLNK